MVIKIGINGFGRVGRLVFRAALFRRDHVQVVAINEPFMDFEQIVYLLKYDTVHGTLEEDVRIEGNTLIVNDWRVIIHRQSRPEDLPWKNSSVDYVIETSKKFITKEQASRHLHQNGAKKVIIAEHSPDAPTFILGINEDQYKQDVKVFSSAGPISTCAAPILKIINDKFGLEKVLITSVHALTNNQKVVDGPSSNKEDLRMGRSAFNIIPSKTMAGKSIEKVLPEMHGNIEAISFRVPISDVSLIDLTIGLKKEASREEIENVLRSASLEKRYKFLLALVDEPLVSSDFISNQYSSIVDINASQFLSKNFIKLIAWFDNEYAFALRTIDLTIATTKGGICTLL